MKFRFVILLSTCTLLYGCVTGTPDNLLSAEPLGQAQNTGQFPIIGRVPEGETVQMTPAEKAKLQADLTRDAAPGQRQAQSNSSEDYQREIARLRLLAKQQEEEMRQRIEGEQPTQ